jgi:hypothetical protein
VCLLCHPGTASLQSLAIVNAIVAGFGLENDFILGPNFGVAFGTDPNTKTSCATPEGVVVGTKNGVTCLIHVWIFISKGEMSGATGSLPIFNPHRARNRCAQVRLVLSLPVKKVFGRLFTLCVPFQGQSWSNCVTMFQDDGATPLEFCLVSNSNKFASAINS